MLELLAAPGPAIVPLGGGALERRPVRDALAGHDVVYVEVGLDTAWNRAQDSGRPLARDRERFARLHAARRPLYESVAAVVLADGAEKTPARGRAGGARAGELRMIWAAQGYPSGWGPERWTRRASCSPIAGAASLWPTRLCCSSTASGSLAWPPPR